MTRFPYKLGQHSLSVTYTYAASQSLIVCVLQGLSRFANDRHLQSRNFSLFSGVLPKLKESISEDKKVGTRFVSLDGLALGLNYGTLCTRSTFN